MNKKHNIHVSLEPGEMKHKQQELMNPEEKYSLEQSGVKTQEEGQQI